MVVAVAVILIVTQQLETKQRENVFTPTKKLVLYIKEIHNALKHIPNQAQAVMSEEYSNSKKKPPFTLIPVDKVSLEEILSKAAIMVEEMHTVEAHKHQMLEVAAEPLISVF